MTSSLVRERTEERACEHIRSVSGTGALWPYFDEIAHFRFKSCPSVSKHLLSTFVIEQHGWRKKLGGHYYLKDLSADFALQNSLLHLLWSYNCTISFKHPSGRR